MAQKRMQHCFWCGEELGVGVHYHGDEPECCGKPECQRELRDELRAQRDERFENAREDDFQRY